MPCEVDRLSAYRCAFDPEEQLKCYRCGLVLGYFMHLDPSHIISACIPCMTVEELVKVGHKV